MVFKGTVYMFLVLLKLGNNAGLTNMKNIFSMCTLLLHYMQMLALVIEMTFILKVKSRSSNRKGCLKDWYRIRIAWPLSSRTNAMYYILYCSLTPSNELG